jgi:hypothetical protein
VKLVVLALALTTCQSPLSSRPTRQCVPDTNRCVDDNSRDSGHWDGGTHLELCTHSGRWVPSTDCLAVRNQARDQFVCCLDTTDRRNYCQPVQFCPGRDR